MITEKLSKRTVPFDNCDIIKYMKEHVHVIKSVEEGSIADEMGVTAGDALLCIDGMPVEDVLDYRFMVRSEELTVLIRKSDGEEWELEIEKDEYEDLGIEFESGLMDEYRSCRNKCIFCFIDQMPKGMRPTLYFKDDDSRLSFLQGNYVTLTNMDDHDIDRIIRYRLSPINISVQSTNPELRCMMLSNRFAGDALSKIRTLYEAGITMNAQIVMCKGVNDKEELRRSLTDLLEYAPVMQSVSVVPVGITRYREGLYPLEPVGREDAEEALSIIAGIQELVCDHAHHEKQRDVTIPRELSAPQNRFGILQFFAPADLIVLKSVSLFEEHVQIVVVEIKLLHSRFVIQPPGR